MEFHAGAQRQAQLRRRHLIPARGQQRLGLEGAAVVVHQRLIDRGMDAVGQGVVLGMDVPGRDVTGTRPLEGLGLKATGRDSQGCSQHDRLHGHGERFHR